MDNDNSLNKRPTFKRALRNISMTSIFITMMLIWLLLSVTSVLTPETVRAKKHGTDSSNNDLQSGSSCRFLPMALQQLKHWQRWASKGNFQLQKYVISSKIFWHPGITPVRIRGDTFSNFISHWLFPAPHHSADSSQWRNHWRSTLNRSRQFNQPFYLVFARRTDRLYSAGIRNRNYPHPPFAQWPGGSTEKYHRCRT